MQKQKAIKELEEIKSYAITNATLETLLPHILLWSITLTIGFLLNYIIRTTSISEPYIIPIWVILIAISSTISTKIDKKQNTLNNKISLIDKHTGIIWVELFSLGIILSVISVLTPMIKVEYMPIIWFLIVGIGELFAGIISKLRIYCIIGTLNIVFGIFLAFNINLLLNYWEFFFIVTEGVIGISYYIIKKVGNKENNK